MATPIDQLLSRTIYSTNGTTTVWDFSFAGGYIDAAHIKAYTETPAGARTAVTGTLIGAYQLQITPALASGDTLVIYRDTPKSVPLVDFTDESGFSEVALDTNAKQAVFIAAEGADTLTLTNIQAAIAASGSAALSAQSASTSEVAAAASELATSNLAAAVNANAANITTVASSIAPVQAVGTNIAAVVTNATHIADIVAAAGNSANINLTATNTANITTVATNTVDVNTVATNIATVVEAAAILNGTPFARTLLDDTTAAEARTTLGAAASAELAAPPGASLVGHISSFVGSAATTVKEFLNRIISLENGSTAHSDGTDTITGSPRWFIGNNAPSTDDSALLIGRGLTGSYNLGAHAIRDESSYTASGTGFYGYASFDAIPTLSGAGAYNHLHGFQARPAYSGSVTMTQLAGFTAQSSHAGSGTVNQNVGMVISDPTGTGTITSNWGIFINDLTRGATNYAIYSPYAVASYHGGNFDFGARVATTGEMHAQALDSFGGPAAFYATGGVGMYGYTGQPYARIQAYSDASGTAKNLSLQSTGGNVYIGSTTTGSSLLSLSTDSAEKPSTNTWQISSDARLKDVIGSYTKGLDALKALRPIFYRYNGKTGLPSDTVNIGVIAQEAQPYVPECVSTYKALLNNGDTEETELLKFDTHALTYMLINAVVELSARLDRVESSQVV